jgi:hypothetical protein
MVSSFMRGEWEMIANFGGYGPDVVMRPWTGVPPGTPGRLVQFEAYDMNILNQMLDLLRRGMTASNYDEMASYAREITRIVQENYGFLGGYKIYSHFFPANNIRNIVLNALPFYPEFFYWYLEN